ncbi:unnamed protein product, partial [Gongylonema pulchrum]|uniref:PRK domain-containing protein n=1 Tax=Gongylonema pulchrum TaxID=637853 RepID=A0A183D595_9BILA
MREHASRHVTIADPTPVPSSTRSSSPTNDVPSRKTFVHRRLRTISGSKSEDHLMMTESGRFFASERPGKIIIYNLQRVYTKGRPPWYDREGKNLKQPYVIGICGGSASGKTTVARRIIERLEMPWVTVLSMDSFYKVLSEEQHHLAARHEYNFDHPQAFDFDLMYETIRRLRDGKSVEVLHFYFIDLISVFYSVKIKKK